ncbi:hypothetical protein B0H63DRAFT_459524 [Podospora didyma]|uniref:Uncharacterized protein n=1 Tax=Podospora didyma TaxID=330526 RepID=A0AAE0U7Y5_9PEZI|nr:hypothetical protein B0H63DRAFT_459524 [Podospora didyma]
MAEAIKHAEETERHMAMLEQWSLYKQGSAQAMAMAKHLGSKADSSVLFEDIANTIDGGN